MIKRAIRRISHWRQQRALSLLPGGKFDPTTVASVWGAVHDFLGAAREANQKAAMMGHSFHETDLFWAECLGKIRQMFNGPPKADFLSNETISRTMGRGVRQGVDECEIPTVASAIQNGFFGTSVIETSVGRSRLEHVSLRLSSSTVGHAWRAVKIHQEFNVDAFDEIIELGGGYGNFCRLMMAHQPQASYVIVDFPEVLALQYLFLRLSVPDLPLTLGDCTAASRPRGTVTLVPVGCAGDLKARGSRTLFTSHFALNESGEKTVAGVCEREFFGTNHAWIALPRTGLQSWGVTADRIEGGLRDTFGQVWVSHIYDNTPKCIVLVARRNADASQA